MYRPSLDETHFNNHGPAGYASWIPGCLSMDPTTRTTGINNVDMYVWYYIEEKKQKTTSSAFTGITQ